MLCMSTQNFIWYSGNTMFLMDMLLIHFKFCKLLQLPKAALLVMFHLMLLGMQEITME